MQGFAFNAGDVGYHRDTYKSDHSFKLIDQETRAKCVLRSNM